MRCQDLHRIFSKPIQPSYRVLSETPSGRVFSLSECKALRNIILSGVSKSKWQNNKCLVQFLPVVTRINLFSFSSLNLDPNFKHTVSCYASLIYALTSHGIPCRFPRVIFLMTSTCSSVVDCFCLVDFCKKFKSQLSHKCYEALLEVLSTFEMVNEMKRVYADMLLEDGLVSRGICIPNLMINAHCKLGYVVEASQYLCKMIQAGLTPDHKTFTFLILGHAKIHQVNDAFQVFKKMVDHGCSQGYDDLILGICGVGNLRLAQSVLNQMLKEGIAPSGMVFHSLVTYCCNLEKYEEIVKIVDILLSSGHPPRLEYCQLLISKLCEGGEKDRAESLLQKLLRSGLYDDEIPSKRWIT